MSYIYNLLKQFLAFLLNSNIFFASNIASLISFPFFASTIKVSKTSGSWLNETAYALYGILNNTGKFSPSPNNLPKDS